MIAATSRKLYGVLAVAVLAICLFQAVSVLRTALGQTLSFDDAYMFYRYAMNIRHGLGMSWNPDGVHTYGETAPLWGMIVVLLSFLPMSAAHALVLGSWVSAVAAVIAMAWAVARNAESETMRSAWRVLPLVAVPLVQLRIFNANAVTGMETMLAATLAALFLGLVIGSIQGSIRLEWAVVAALAIFLTRPEMASSVMLVPLLCVLLGRIDPAQFARFAGLFLAGIVLNLIFCKFYFHTALPLSFYMKSGHAYQGYVAGWHPVSEAVNMLKACWFFLLLPVLFGRRNNLWLLVACLVPALLTFGYLLTVTQIMGWTARYYAPYLPFFVVPALLMVDRGISEADGISSNDWLRRRFVAVGAVILFIAAAVRIVHPHGLARTLGQADRYVEGRQFAYEPAVLEISAAVPLPAADPSAEAHVVGDLMCAPMPAGTVIAASEVGYLGAANTRITVIDLEGLNDTDIALRGFNVASLLKRTPDIIWMPHSAYTYQRGLLLSDLELLRQYDLYAGAADYGIALRKASPLRSQIDRQMAILWQAYYPGSKMDDYKVKSATWTGRAYPVKDIDR